MIADPPHMKAPMAIYFCESCGAHFPHMGSKRSSQRAALHQSAGHVVVVTERDPATMTVTGVTRDGKIVKRDDVKRHIAEETEHCEPIYWCQTCGWSIAQDQSEQSYQDMLDHQALGHVVVVTEADPRDLQVTARQRTSDDAEQINDAITRIKAGESNVAVSLAREPELLLHGTGRVQLQKEPVAVPARQDDEEESFHDL